MLIYKKCNYIINSPPLFLYTLWAMVISKLYSVPNCCMIPDGKQLYVKMETRTNLNNGVPFIGQSQTFTQQIMWEIFPKDSSFQFVYVIMFIYLQIL